jgi:sugar (pentulose or hexulose) kinase
VPGKYVLAIDAGSSGCRSLIIDLQGNLVSAASQEWAYDVPPEVAPVGKEFDAGKFWNIICSPIRESITKAGIAFSHTWDKFKVRPGKAKFVALTFGMEGSSIVKY